MNIINTLLLLIIILFLINHLTKGNILNTFKSYYNKFFNNSLIYDFNNFLYKLKHNINLTNYNIKNNINILNYSNYNYIISHLYKKFYSPNFKITNINIITPVYYYDSSFNNITFFDMFYFTFNLSNNSNYNIDLLIGIQLLLDNNNLHILNYQLSKPISHFDNNLNQNHNQYDEKSKNDNIFIKNEIEENNAIYSDSLIPSNIELSYEPSSKTEISN